MVVLRNAVEAHGSDCRGRGSREGEYGLCRQRFHGTRCAESTESPSVCCRATRSPNAVAQWRTFSVSRPLMIVRLPRTKTGQNQRLRGSTALNATVMGNSTRVAAYGVSDPYCRSEDDHQSTRGNPDAPPRVGPGAGCGHHDGLRSQTDQRKQVEPCIETRVLLATRITSRPTS